MQIPEIDVVAAQTLLSEGGAVFVDVRDPGSYAGAHIPGALLVDDGNVDEFVRTSDKSRPLVVYCYHGNSSRGGTAYFLDQGFQSVYSMMGGFEAWRSARLPIER